MRFQSQLGLMTIEHAPRGPEKGRRSLLYVKKVALAENRRCSQGRGAQKHDFSGKGLKSMPSASGLGNFSRGRKKKKRKKPSIYPDRGERSTIQKRGGVRSDYIQVEKKRAACQKMIGDARGHFGLRKGKPNPEAGGRLGKFRVPRN